MQIQHVMILEWATVFLMRFWQLHNKKKPAQNNDKRKNSAQQTMPKTQMRK